jgi:hypothetical protein
MLDHCLSLRNDSRRLVPRPSKQPERPARPARRPSSESTCSHAARAPPRRGFPRTLAPAFDRAGPRSLALTTCLTTAPAWSHSKGPPIPCPPLDRMLAPRCLTAMFDQSSIHTHTHAHAHTHTHTHTHARTTHTHTHTHRHTHTIRCPTPQLDHLIGPACWTASMLLPERSYYGVT